MGGKSRIRGYLTLGASVSAIALYCCSGGEAYAVYFPPSDDYAAPNTTANAAAPAPVIIPDTGDTSHHLPYHHTSITYLNNPEELSSDKSTHSTQAKWVHNVAPALQANGLPATVKPSPFTPPPFTVAQVAKPVVAAPAVSAPKPAAIAAAAPPVHAVTVAAAAMPQAAPIIVKTTAPLFTPTLKPAPVQVANIVVSPAVMVVHPVAAVATAPAMVIGGAPAQTTASGVAPPAIIATAAPLTKNTVPTLQVAKAIAAPVNIAPIQAAVINAPAVQPVPVQIAAAPTPQTQPAPLMHNAFVAAAPIPGGGLTVATVAAAAPVNKVPFTPMPSVAAVPSVRVQANNVVAPTGKTDFAALAPAAGGAASPAIQLPPAVNPVMVPAAPFSETGDLPDETQLSPQSKRILNNLPPEPHSFVSHPQPVTVNHARKNALETDTEVKEHNGIGMSIKIKSVKANVSTMLEDAYTALMAGNQEEAIRLYKNVLQVQPDNKLALFGLATTYHRAGQTQLARPLYGRLLAIDPNNVEGLNNFLVLLGDESPNEALIELTRLEETHPHFSPLPAQIADIYARQGDYPHAVQQMDHAIQLSPENLKYRYNMAVILDKAGQWDDAATFYQQLLTAYDRGEKLPTSSEEIQERLTFIRSNKPSKS